MLADIYPAKQELLPRPPPMMAGAAARAAAVLGALLLLHCVFAVAKCERPEGAMAQERWVLLLIPLNGAAVPSRGRGCILPGRVVTAAGAAAFASASNLSSLHPPSPNTQNKTHNTTRHHP